MCFKRNTAIPFMECISRADVEEAIVYYLDNLNILFDMYQEGDSQPHTMQHIQQTHRCVALY